ncbi:MAG: carbohydrate kinase family protein [Candidatus Marinimicrobia bacterium]|jgi:sugar/nucleoside kinase (ribokinase family)|nr:carbohydrate kinase family protein [Candidatus Neomarinimicrobiota bacterium]NLA21822.1 carbohydrate kinase family protein [Candidatus Neomarinimicrobiota bacterium]OQC47324.1 MAG: putative sugar kinase YdjH [Candidatus Marinimicrobia bacterium ADurb.Bin030]HOD37378.1 carbohydrate kinase family protein [Candidatus Neomarinimicrobiota bacterium]HOG75422.1 carbohydrate kinase family protein [Candidatus Neomarinimicrobiota bacterium]
MEKKKDLEIVAAGHTCLDLIPAFTIEGEVEKMTDVLVPGKMINMGECVIAGGGPVTNAGVSIRRLGVKTELIGKVGNDDFGRLVLDWYEKNEGHFKGIKMVDGESTSYTIAICIPGIDRFYLHHCGANDTFGYDDMDFNLVGRAKLMLFGYPPWMRKIYENTGAELTKILKKTKELGTTTALDLSLPDVDSYAGQVDWKAILTDWVPLSDIMVPSAEELFYFLYKDKFLEKRDKLRHKETVLDQMTVKEISTMGRDLIRMGAAIAMIKCGSRGLYIYTAGQERLKKMGAAGCADLENWANRELWFPVYQEEKFVGALGSGDSAIAGFLSAFVWGHSIESCLRYANAAGSMNVTVPDGLSWNKGFDDLTRRIKAGWKTKEMKINEPGWKKEREFWVGPDNRGKWES